MLSIFKKKEKVKNVEELILKENYLDIEPIAKYFQNQTGIIFDKQKSILKNKTTSFCRQRDIYSFDELLLQIKSNEYVKQEFINYLTTNETSFYREFRQIEELISHVKKSSKYVKILCAPSSTGEEPYSIAIALLESGVSSNSFEILGIDINSDVIKRAKLAVYKEADIRNLTYELREKYFIKDSDKFRLKESIKSLVSFKICNIFDNSFMNLGKFDFVFSRNMLIYFDKETKKRAKNILENMRNDKSVDVFFGHADLF